MAKNNKVPELKDDGHVSSSRSSVGCNSMGSAQVGSYYVYLLKDPRMSPAKPFYVGKGVGTRAWDHLIVRDNTKKGKLISEILDAGDNVLVSKVCENLTEIQAIRIEAELIAALGLRETGGLLLNSVRPTGLARVRKREIVAPSGVSEKAQLGLSLLLDAVLELAKANPNGVTNADVCHALGLHSSYNGGSKDYLSWSLLGLLMQEGQIKRDNQKGKGRHVAQVK